MASVVAYGGILPLDHLPSALLQQIMGFLDLHGLLATSAVSTRLHECALSSLRSIKLFHPTKSACRFLSAYLETHGQHVSSLQLLCSRCAECIAGPQRACAVHYMDGDLKELPAMPSLQHLELQHLAVGRGVLQTVAACTQLTQLCINECDICRIQGKADITASDLAGLPHLQHLQLIRCPLHPEFGTVLSVLVKLTHLTLGWQTSEWGVSPSDWRPVLQHITCAANLRELRLPDAIVDGIEGPAALSSFPSLTSLQQLSFLQFNARAKVQPGLPSSLQRLVVCVHHFDPAWLAGVAQLKHLELQVSNNSLLSFSAVRARASEALLLKLADLTQLTFLKLTAPINAGSAAAYAFAASSQLQYLELVNGWREVLPHLFSSVDCSLPQLQHLAFHRPEEWWLHLNLEPPERRDCIALPTMGHAFLARAVACCRTLQHLDITDALSREVDLSPLLRAPHLTALLVSTITDPDAAQVVAQLSNLQRLEVGRMGRDGRITAAGLQHLTALQHLTLLKLTGDGSSSGWPERPLTQREALFEQTSWSGEGDSPDYEGEWSDDGAAHDGTADLSTAVQRMDVSPGPGSHSPRPHSELGPPCDSSEELSCEQTGHGSCRLYSSECRLSDACLATIAQITSLRELHLFDHMDLTDAGMLELAALKQLTWLEVEGPVALLNEKVPCNHVRVPSDEWQRGLTQGTPVWPELLDLLVRQEDRPDGDKDVSQRARQATLDNREALLGVLGPELAREVAELRLFVDRSDWGGEETYFYEESELELRHEADGRVVFLGHREWEDMPAARLQTTATAMRERLWRVVTTLAPAPVDIISLCCECTDSQGSQE